MRGRRKVWGRQRKAGVRSAMQAHSREEKVGGSRAAEAARHAEGGGRGITARQQARLRARRLREWKRACTKE